MTTPRSSLDEGDESNFGPKHKKIIQHMQGNILYMFDCRQIWLFTSFYNRTPWLHQLK